METLKVILTGICILAALGEFTHSRWLTKNFCTCGECKKSSSLKPFNRIVGISTIITLVLMAVPSMVPLTFYAGWKFQTFIQNAVARKLLA